MKSWKILLVLLIVSLVLSEKCELGCIKCEKRICQSCYRSFLNHEGKCQEISKNHDKNCAIFKQNNECTMCELGYALKKNQKNLPIQCHKIYQIANCTSAFIQENQSAKCHVCNTGIPAPNFLTCLPFVKFNSNLHELDENCLWGARDLGNIFSCFLCKKGYTLVNGSCKHNFGVSGCMVGRDDNQCLECNPYLGYHMTDNNTCEGE